VLLTWIDGQEVFSDQFIELRLIIREVAPPHLLADTKAILSVLLP
jgi:hypothetical protein